jgi:hypothetical protein
MADFHPNTFKPIDPIPPPQVVRTRLARIVREARLLRSQLRVSRRAAEEGQQDAEHAQREGTARVV